MAKTTKATKLNLSEIPVPPRACARHDVPTLSTVPPPHVRTMEDVAKVLEFGGEIRELAIIAEAIALAERDRVADADARASFDVLREIAVDMSTLACCAAAALRGEGWACGREDDGPEAVARIAARLHALRDLIAWDSPSALDYLAPVLAADVLARSKAGEADAA